MTLNCLGATYYLGVTDASDLYTATQAQNPNTPWATIAKCLSEQADGDIFLIENGTYGELSDNTAKSDWVTWRADTGQASVVFSGITFEYGGAPRDIYVRVDGVNVADDDPGDKSEPVYLRGVQQVEILNCTVTANHYINSYCIYVGGTQAPNFITIRGNTCTDSFRGIRAYGDDITVDNNVVHTISSDCIVAGGNRLVITGNEMYNVNTQLAVDAGEATEGQIFDYHPDCLTVWSQTALFDDIEVSGNIARDCDDTSTWNHDIQGLVVFNTFPGNPWTNIVMENNFVHGVVGEGDLFIEGCASCDINNNTVIGQMRVSVVHFDNNTVVDEMYNNIAESFDYDIDTGGTSCRVIAHGNNIYGNDPQYTGASFTFDFETGVTDFTDHALTTLFTDYPGDDELTQAGDATGNGNITFAPSTDRVGETTNNPADIGSRAMVASSSGTASINTTRERGRYSGGGRH